MVLGTVVIIVILLNTNILDAKQKQELKNIVTEITDIFSSQNQQEKSMIKESASKFIEGFYHNDYEASKPVIDPGTMMEDNVRNIFEAQSKLLSMAFGLTEIFQGMEPKITYSIENIDLVDDSHAKVTYKFTSNISSESTEQIFNFVKSNGVWKIYFPNFIINSF